MANSPVVTLRIPADRLARINSRAQAAGLTRSQYMVDRADPEGRVERATDSVVMVVGVDGPGCLHPKADRQVYGWGTVCGQCGTKIR